MLLVHLTNAEGDTLAGARVTADPSMPAMDMGKHPVTLAPAAPGDYQTSLRFTMPGAWNVTVTAVRGRERAVQTVSVTVR